MGSITILEALKHSDKKIKFYQASSSEMFGGSSKETLNESSAFNPKSPYGVAKASSHMFVVNY